MPYELAMQDENEAWDMLLELDTMEECVDVAKVHAGTFFAVNGDAAPATAIFGVSNDPASGHYETRIEIDRDGTTRIS